MESKPMVEVRMRRALLDAKGLVKGAPGSQWPADDPDVLRQPSVVQRVLSEPVPVVAEPAPAPVEFAAPITLEDDPAPSIAPRPRGWGKPKHHKPSTEDEG